MKMMVTIIIKIYKDVAADDDIEDVGDGGEDKY